MHFEQYLIVDGFETFQWESFVLIMILINNLLVQKYPKYPKIMSIYLHLCFFKYLEGNIWLRKDKILRKSTVKSTLIDFLIKATGFWVHFAF